MKIQNQQKFRKKLLENERNDDPGNPQIRGSGSIAKLRATRVFFLLCALCLYTRGVRAAIASLGYKGSQIFFHILILNPLDLLAFPSVGDELFGDWGVTMRCLGAFLFVDQRTGMPALLSNRQNVLR